MGPVLQVPILRAARRCKKTQGRRIPQSRKARHAGSPGGLGRIEGMVLMEFDAGYTMSEPFDLRESGTFKAPASGNLYLAITPVPLVLGDIGVADRQRAALVNVDEAGVVVQFGRKRGGV